MSLKSIRLLGCVFLSLALGALACTMGSGAAPEGGPGPAGTSEGQNGFPQQEVLLTGTPAADTGAQSQTGSPAAPFLDLAALPFGTEVAPNYSEHFIMAWEGIGLNGQPLSQEWDFLTYWYSDPESGYTTRIRVTEDGVLQTVSSTSVFGGQSYFYDKASGCFIFPVSAEDSRPNAMFGNDIELAGTAVLEESGLQVNGLLVDRYSIGSDNFVSTQGFQPGEYSLESAELYFVPAAGYVTRLAMSGTSDSRDFDFDGPAGFVYTIDFLPLAAGDSPVPPEGCQGASVGGADFPRSEDAYEIITLPDGLFYKSRLSLDAILAIYRQALPDQGWTLEEENNFEAQATLVFAKDERHLTVNAFVNGDEISVSLFEEP